MIKQFFFKSFYYLTIFYRFQGNEKETKKDERIIIFLKKAHTHTKEFDNRKRF